MLGLMRMMLSYPDQPCPQEEGRERVKNPSYPNLEKEALFYLAWAGFMNRIHFVGAIRPHTPMCDATPPPPKTIMKHLATGPTHENIHIFLMRTE